MTKKYKILIIVLIVVLTIPTIFLYTTDYLQEVYPDNIVYKNIVIKKPTELEIDYLSYKDELYLYGIWPTSYMGFGKLKIIQDEKRYFLKKKSDNSELILQFEESEIAGYGDMTWLPDLNVNKNTNFFKLNSNHNKCIKINGMCSLELIYKDIHLYIVMLNNQKKFLIPIDEKMIEISFKNNFTDNSILVKLFDEINKIENLKN